MDTNDLKRVVVDGLLDIEEVESLTKQKKSALYAAIRAGKFPAPYRVGLRRVAWKSSEIQGHIDSLERVSPVNSEAI